MAANQLTLKLTQANIYSGQILCDSEMAQRTLENPFLLSTAKKVILRLPFNTGKLDLVVVLPRVS